MAIGEFHLRDHKGPKLKSDATSAVDVTHFISFGVFVVTPLDFTVELHDLLLHLRFGL